jgi:hypothetical protein
VCGCLGVLGEAEDRDKECADEDDGEVEPDHARDASRRQEGLRTVNGPEAGMKRRPAKCESVIERKAA